MKNLASRYAVLAVFWLWMGSLISSGQENPAGTSQPENYDEIKALLDGYASAIDNYGDTETDKKELLAKGDEETSALVALLKTRHFPQEKIAIVLILEHNKATNKKNSARLLAKELPEKVETWQGSDRWIIATIKFLTKVDPDTARNVSEKGLRSTVPEIQYAAINALAAVGTVDDIGSLKPFLDERNSEKGKQVDTAENVLGDAASNAKAQIFRRTPSKN